MEFSRQGINIGPMLLSTFGIVVVIGISAGAAVGMLRARARGEEAGIVLDLAVRATWLGVIFGRLLYVWSPPPSLSQTYSHDWYMGHPGDLLAGPLAVWNGGLDPGGVTIGALLGLLWVLRSNRLELRMWADILTPGVLTALAIMPWANLISGQMLGPVTNLPWGVSGTESALLQGSTRYQPTPAYVAMWAAAALVSVLIIEKRRLQAEPGNLFLVGALIVLPGLVAADWLRTDVPRYALGLTSTQIVAIAALAGLGIVVWRRRRGISDESGGVSAREMESE